VCPFQYSDCSQRSKSCAQFQICNSSNVVGMPPSPRSDHTATVHANRYLLIFGGGSHSTCFNDLHVLDLQSMEWSRPKMQGTFPTPRAGHAGVTIGENWYIVGGGDNKSLMIVENAARSMLSYATF
jgi:hypothetical protein